MLKQYLYPERKVTISDNDVVLGIVRAIKAGETATAFKRLEDELHTLLLALYHDTLDQ